MYDVSVIIPIYCVTEKDLEWLGECIDSACSQDAEVVAVDDGSPINVLDVVAQFQGRIHFARISHLGVAAARNQAVLRSTGKLLIPLDCDDRFVPGAVNRLLSFWDGSIPVYPDVRKFGEENVAHFHLLDFHCDHIYNHVGFSSVNVLHLKDQWRIVGGWNEKLDFYEDGEYNARLFARYCGKHLSEPLVEYRMHDHQRTKQYKTRAHAYAKQIMTSVRRIEMACKTCGGVRSQFINRGGGQVATSSTTDPNTLPGEIDGRILSQYIGGKGSGRHYYNGRFTKFPYKVKYGDFVYADPRDTRDEADTANPSMLIRYIQVKPPVAAIAQPAAKPVAPSAQAAEPKSEPVRTPRTAEGVERTPVAKPEVKGIQDMPVKDILTMEGLEPAEAKRLLAVEKRNRNRAKVVEFLTRISRSGPPPE